MAVLQIRKIVICALNQDRKAILRNLQSVATTLRVEDINTECDVGLLQLCYQSAGESGEQTILHSYQINRRAVAR